MRYIVTDIETVPTSGVGKLPEPTPEDPNPFPPLPCHVPIVIGTMEFDEHYMPAGASVIPGTEEEKLRTFSEMMRGNKTLVSWNGRGFDVPVIVLRCFHYGIQMPWYYQARDMRYRFSEVGHHDVMDAMGDFGAAKRLHLDEAAKLIGLPGKVGVDGSQVEGLWKDGKLTEIENYCMTDVAQTAFVWLRYQYIRAEIEKDEYLAATRTLLRGLETNLGRYGVLLEQTDRKILLLGHDDGQQQRPSSVPGDEGQAQGRDSQVPAQDGQDLRSDGGGRQDPGGAPDGTPSLGDG